MWSPWPWEIVMTSMRSKVLPSRGQDGLPSTQGSSRTTRPPLVESLNVLWPSHVSENPRSSFFMLHPASRARHPCRNRERRISAACGGHKGRRPTSSVATRVARLRTWTGPQPSLDALAHPLAALDHAVHLEQAELLPRVHVEAHAHHAHHRLVARLRARRRRCFDPGALGGGAQHALEDPDRGLTLDAHERVVLGIGLLRQHAHPGRRVRVLAHAALESHPREAEEPQ